MVTIGNCQLLPRDVSQKEFRWNSTGTQQDDICKLGLLMLNLWGFFWRADAETFNQPGSKFNDFPANYSGWWFGTLLLFSPIVGMMIQSDELILFRGVGQPPISISWWLHSGPQKSKSLKRNSELGTKLNWVMQVFSSLDMALQVAVSQVIKTGNGKC